MAEQDQRSIADIEAEASRLKQAIQEIGSDAQANAHYIQEHGHVFGPPGREMSSGGAEGWEAPRAHPVWAPELAHEADVLERMGSATFEYEGTRALLERWASARPEHTHDRPQEYALERGNSLRATPQRDRTEDDEHQRHVDRMEGHGW